MERGDHDIAVTLAGAAEGMLPALPDQPVFAGMRDMRPADWSEKEWVRALNWERDWLKHQAEHAPESIDVGLADAAYMIVRAMGKLPTWSPRMKQFKDWFFNDFLPPQYRQRPKKNS